MVGQSDLALKHADTLEDQPADYAEAFVGIFTLPAELIHARFGMWDAILADAASQQDSPKELRTPFAQGNWEYVVNSTLHRHHRHHLSVPVLEARRIQRKSDAMRDRSDPNG